MTEISPCLFCLIVEGKVPCHKVYETEHSLAFLDINPVSDGHTLVIPKVHGRTLLDIPDESLRDIGPVLKVVARATGAKDFNVMQNNGKLAFFYHVHFHIVPKPNEEEGVRIKLGETIIQKKVTQDELAATAAEIKKRIQESQ
ncbi:HIT-like protein [Auricularia subglabra TFB-10046 SS5]|nr:HIT-like protein [Auricularia subglabra TFB-10046 SS5]